MEPEQPEPTPGAAPELERPRRRLLRRIFNGRTEPLIADERPFLSYKEASRYLLSLPEDARESAYRQLKAAALGASGEET